MLVVRHGFFFCIDFQLHLLWSDPSILIDLIHKSHNAPVPYPTMHHSEQKCAHFCSEWCIVGYGTGALWDLWIRSIGIWDTAVSSGTSIVNSLAPGRYWKYYTSVISEHMLWIMFMSTFCEIPLRWMPQYNFDEKSALVQVKACCR